MDRLATYDFLLLLLLLLLLVFHGPSPENVGHLLDRLQSILILNAAARLVFSVRCSERITPLLRDLHWLRVPERIQFHLCVLAFHCLNGSAPPYLAESFRRMANAEGRRHLCSSTTMTLVPSVQ